MDHADSWGELDGGLPILKERRRVIIALILHINITSCKQKQAKARKQ
jgi:hypothetical protein